MTKAANTEEEERNFGINDCHSKEFAEIGKECSYSFRASDDVECLLLPPNPASSLEWRLVLKKRNVCSLSCLCV